MMKILIINFHLQAHEAMESCEMNEDDVQSNDMSFVHRHRKFLLNDDNYIMNTVSLCETHRQMPSRGEFSLLVRRIALVP